MPWLPQRPTSFVFTYRLSGFFEQWDNKRSRRATQYDSHEWRPHIIDRAPLGKAIQGHLQMVDSVRPVFLRPSGANKAANFLRFKTTSYTSQCQRAFLIIWVLLRCTSCDVRGALCFLPSCCSSAPLTARICSDAAGVPVGVARIGSPSLLRFHDR